MLNWLKAFMARFRKKHVEPARPTSGHNRPPKTEVINREDEGAHFYLGDILRDIRSTHRMLKALKRVDPEAYAFQGRVGARILPAKSMTLANGLPEKLPAVGMTYLTDGRGTKDWVSAVFTYFSKVESPIGVQPFNGTVYSMSTVYNKDGKALSFTFYVGIGADRIAVPLREIRYNPVRKKMMALSGGGWSSKAGTNHGGKVKARCAGSVVEMKPAGWGVNQFLLDALEDGKKSGTWPADTTLQQYVHELTCICLNAWAIRASDELMVRVRRGRSTALFSVSTKRTPYFFKDRDTTVAADGKRKRIFHIVREHTRNMADGSIQQVKEHYRGERRFKWDGADVTISVPDRHHADVTAMDFAGVAFDDKTPVPKGYLTPADVGRKISEAIS